MKPILRSALAFAFSFLASGNGFAQDERLGEVNFPVSCNAAEASGNINKARSWYKKFTEVTAQADAGVAQVEHAKMFLAQR